MNTRFNGIIAAITATAMSVGFFSSIYAESLNDNSNSTNGMIIADSVTTNNSVVNLDTFATQSNSTDTITLNVSYIKTLNPGDVHTYYFTPPTSGLYTVETFGSTDTYGSVHCVSPSGNFTDDDSGEGRNFAIGFRQNAGNRIEITVRHYNSSSGTGEYQIHVRKQRALIYTFDYGNGDINTTGDVVKPSASLNSMGYLVNAYQNKSSSHILDKEFYNIKRLNSEVVFFSGHGDEGSLTFYDGTRKSYLFDTGLINMGNTKVAVWSACNSGKAPSDTGGTSIAQKSIDMGAKSAIGWSVETNVGAAKKWTDKFFSELENGATVNNAAASAGSVFLWPWDGSYSGWSVFGDGSIKVINSNVNHKTAANYLNVVNQKQFDDFLSNYEYVEYELKGKGVRYYKTINGCLTNDYYDVIDNGTTIIKSNNTITKNDIAKVKSQDQIVNTSIISKSINIEDSVYGKLINSEEHIVYMMINENIIPIKIIYADYENDYGITQDVICINLLDNSLIDYADICAED